MKGIVAGVLTLIVLDALGSNVGQGGKLLVWLQTGLTHALSPKVAAIPTRKPQAKQPTTPAPSSSSTGGIVLPRNPSVGAVST